MRSITVAFSTFQESIRQPAFYALLVLGVFLMLISYVMPTFQLSQGEVKFVRDIGLGTFTICILLLGIFSASNLITTEIENRTAMTVMSKPLRRHEFVIGKYLGIILSIVFLGLLLSAVFIPVIIGKVVGGDIVWRHAQPYEGIWPEVSYALPGLALAFFQTAVLVAVSVALSIWLPMVLNVTVSFGLYIWASIAGPLVDYLKEEQSALEPIIRSVSYLLPSLRGNTESYSAIGLGKMVPLSFLLLSMAYSLLYIGAAISAAVFLFQDRELG